MKYDKNLEDERLSRIQKSVFDELTPENERESGVTLEFDEITDKIKSILHGKEMITCASSLIDVLMCLAAFTINDIKGDDKVRGFIDDNIKDIYKAFIVLERKTLEERKNEAS